MKAVNKNPSTEEFQYRVYDAVNCRILKSFKSEKLYRPPFDGFELLVFSWRFPDIVSLPVIFRIHAICSFTSTPYNVVIAYM